MTGGLARLRSCAWQLWLAHEFLGTIFLPGYDEAKQVELLINNEVDCALSMQLGNITAAMVRTPDYKRREVITVRRLSDRSPASLSIPSRLAQRPTR